MVKVFFSLWEEKKIHVLDAEKIVISEGKFKYFSIFKRIQKIILKNKNQRHQQRVTKGKKNKCLESIASYSKI